MTGFKRQTKTITQNMYLLQTPVTLTDLQKTIALAVSEAENAGVRSSDDMVKITNGDEYITVYWETEEYTS